MVFLLLVQSIRLSWDKSARGPECANARRRFPQAFPLTALPSGEAVLHRLQFSQQGAGFLDELTELRRSMEWAAPKLGLSRDGLQRELQKRKRVLRQYCTQAFSSALDLNLTNLDVRPFADGYAVSFFYDRFRSGAPYRRGRNQDYQNPRSPLYGKDCLNEPAFLLKPGQYGRVLWNERMTGGDTGEWYYLFHIYNLFCLEDQPSKNLLTAKEPDFVYRQLADLYGIGPRR